MKVLLTAAAILNVFCLSAWLVDTCFGLPSFTLTDLSLPPTPPTPPHHIHPSLTTTPLGFVIPPLLSPFPNYLFSSPLSPPLLPAAPFISHLSIFSFHAPDSFIFTSFHSHSTHFSLIPPLLFILTSPTLHQPFQNFSLLDLPTLPGENDGRVHGTEAGRDRGWPWGGMWRGVTVMDVFSSGWVLCPDVEHEDLIFTLLILRSPIPFLR